MRTATITLQVTEAATRPEGAPTAAFGGFRLTITRPDGSTATPPPGLSTTWRIGNFAEGQTYRLLVEAIDVNGAAIQALPPVDVVVPMVPTFTRVDGVAIDWD
jgi:hypothetical protein